jgi:hypothetical protein
MQAEIKEKKRKTKLKSAATSSELKPWIVKSWRKQKVNSLTFQWGKTVSRLFFPALTADDSPVYRSKHLRDSFADIEAWNCLSCPINWNIKEIYSSHFWCFLMINLRHFLYFRWMSLWTLNRVKFIDGRRRSKGLDPNHNSAFPSKAIWNKFQRLLWLPSNNIWFNRQKRCRGRREALRRSLLQTAIITLFDGSPCLTYVPV